MFDRTDLRAAVEAGALSADQASRLEAFLKARSDPDRMLDPENLRFLTNFNDIFLAIGIGILLTGLSFLSGSVLGGALGEQKLAVTLIPIPVLIASWLLAEYFCGRRRLLLPSMVLSVVIVVCVAISVGSLFVPDFNSDMGRDFEDIVPTLGFAAFGAAALGALGIYARFRLPFALFLVALSVAGLFYTAVGRMGDEDMLFGGMATLIAGLATLAAAIAFDARDPQRASRNSDNAFWLHMAAAPQIIFGLRGLIIGSGFAPAGMADAMVMLAALVVFGLFSLALNRRALIVSGLISFAAALGVVVENLGGGVVNTLMLTALLVGASIVLLGGGWRTARRTLLRVIPDRGFAGRIFPPEPA